MNEPECGGLCPSVCFCMCASVSHPKCVLSAQASVLERRRTWARLAANSQRRYLGASVEGGCFERRMARGGERAKLLYREMDRMD